MLVFQKMNDFFIKSKVEIFDDSGASHIHQFWICKCYSRGIPFYEATHVYKGNQSCLLPPNESLNAAKRKCREKYNLLIKSHHLTKLGALNER